MSAAGPGSPRLRSGAWPVVPGRSKGGWALVLVAIAALLGGSLFVLRLVERGPQPPFIKNGEVLGPENWPRRAPERPQGVLQLAGSGTNLPLTRALVDAYVAANPQARIRVHESIGSQGGVRAVLDGAVDLALVSRKLHTSERESLTEQPYALDAVVFGAHPSVPIDGITSGATLDLYAGRTHTWSDGTRVVVVQREEGESSHAVAGEALDGFREVDDTARTTGRWQVVFHDRAMQEALTVTPGSIGLFDLGAAVLQKLPIKVLDLDGVTPNEANVLAGRYPMYKQLAFGVPKGTTHDERERFLAFVFSETGERIIRESGYIPMPRDGWETGH